MGLSIGSEMNCVLGTHVPTICLHDDMFYGIIKLCHWKEVCRETCI